MKNLLVPQAFLQYQLISSLKKVNSTDTNVKTSSFGTKPLQKIVPLAKIVGPYKPSCVVGKINIPPKSKKYRIDRDFLNIENHKLSLLVPEIRIYRVSGKGESRTYKPFYFPVTNDFNYDGTGKIDLSKPYSSNAAVIKSFNLDFLGNNPYQAGVGMLQASLEVEVDSLSVLFDKPDDSYAELADLFVIRTQEGKQIPGSNKTPQKGALKSGKSLQIAVTLGYSIQDKDNIFTPEEKEAIKSMKMLINLFYSGHNLSLQQNGSASFSAQYHGNLEAADQDFIYNVVEKSETKKKILEITSAGNASAAEEKKQKAKDIKKQTPGKTSKDKKSDDKLSVLEKPNHLTSIVMEFSKVFDSLHKSEKFYASTYNKEAGFYTFSDSLFKESKKTQPSQIVTSASESADLVAADEANLGASASTTTASEADPFAIFAKSPYFFYVTFGDFVDSLVAKIAKHDLAAMEKNITSQLSKKQITKEKATEQTKEIQAARSFLQSINILFADINFRAKGSKEEKTINIADIPISSDIIYSQMYKDYIKPKKYFMGLKETLVSFCLGILNKSMSSISGSDLIEKVKFRVSNIAALNLSSKIKEGKVNVNEIKSDKTSLLSATEKQRANLIIFHQERCSTTSSPGKGDPQSDYDNGIIHLRTSQDRGLVKQISFSQMQVPGRAEYAMTGHGGAYDELRMPQNASVSMFGNMIFMPTMEVYIDPNSLGFGDPRRLASAARRLGFGGYYSVIKVTTSFASGVLSTQLQLTFAGYPETVGEPKRTKGAIEGTKQVNDIRKTASTVTQRKPKK